MVSSPALDDAVNLQARQALNQFRDGEALNADLIAGAQAIEHPEITRYGTLLAWARHVGPLEAEAAHPGDLWRKRIPIAHDFFVRSDASQSLDVDRQEALSKMYRLDVQSA